jgi:hypothetical protein
MASYSLGRFNRFVEKLFNIKGGPTVLDVDPSTRLILPIFSGVEDRYLQGWGRYAIATTTNAVAAVNSGAQLRNPLGSGMLLVIEKMILQAGSATSVTSISQAVNAVDLPSAGTGFRIDQRNNPNSTAIFSQSTAAGTGNLANLMAVVSAPANGYADYILTVDQELTLLPGDTIRFVNNTVNELLRSSLVWRERALETSELT